MPATNLALFQLTNGDDINLLYIHSPWNNVTPENKRQGGEEQQQETKAIGCKGPGLEHTENT